MAKPRWLLETVIYRGDPFNYNDAYMHAQIICSNHRANRYIWEFFLIYTSYSGKLILVSIYVGVIIIYYGVIIITLILRWSMDQDRSDIGDVPLKCWLRSFYGAY